MPGSSQGCAGQFGEGDIDVWGAGVCVGLGMHIGVLGMHIGVLPLGGAGQGWWA